MKRWTAIPVSLLLLFFVAIAARGDVSPTDLDWIAAIEGVSPVSMSPSSHSVVAHYQVARAADAFNAVMRGLEARGWKVRSVSDVQNSRASVRTLQARRGPDSLLVSIPNGVELGGTMQVTLSDRVIGTAGTAIIPGDYGRPVVLSDINGVTRTIEVNGADCMLSGSKNLITIQGHCRRLTVNGRDNHVRVLGGVARIEFNGDGNTVHWSPAPNSTAPVVFDHGVQNRIATEP